MMVRRRVIVIAHRGASADAPESTQAAIRTAFLLGADMVELDVQLTEDQRLVIFHDDRLERTTTGTGTLSNWRYRDLARLDCGTWLAPRFAGERMLLLSQALRLVKPPHGINLELKRATHPTTVVRKVVQCLHWTRTLSRVLVSSFEVPLLAHLKVRYPRVARALLCRRRPARALRQAIALGCVALHPHRSLVSPTLIKHAHASGLRVHVWTVDRLDEARRFVQMGVDGLVTNVPGRLRHL